MSCERKRFGNKNDLFYCRSEHNGCENDNANCVQCARVFIRLVFGTLYKVGVVDRCIDESKCAGALLARVLCFFVAAVSVQSRRDKKECCRWSLTGDSSQLCCLRILSVHWLLRSPKMFITVLCLRFASKNALNKCCGRFGCRRAKNDYLYFSATTNAVCLSCTKNWKSAGDIDIKRCALNVGAHRFDNCDCGTCHITPP